MKIYHLSYVLIQQKNFMFSYDMLEFLSAYFLAFEFGLPKIGLSSLKIELPAMIQTCLI